MWGAIVSDRPILCIDFDGCAHAYSRGWQSGEIYDDVVLGFFAWAEKASKQFKLVVYSSRSKTPEGIAAMMAWFRRQAALDGYHDTPCGEGTLRFLNAHAATLIILEFANEKPPAYLTIDDRAICFRGDWSAPELQPDAMKAFKPWMQVEAASKPDWTTAAAALVAQLEHGDEGHRKWLRDKAIPLIADALASAAAS